MSLRAGGYRSGSTFQGLRELLKRVRITNSGDAIVRVAENGYNSISKETWEKAAALMMMMGYEDASVSLNLPAL